MCKILIDHHYHLYTGFTINLFIHGGRDGGGDYPSLCIQYFLVGSNMLNVIRQLLHVK